MHDIIPKIIHYCWFGGNPLPKDALECIASWKKYLPDYEIKEWNENNFDVNCCPYVKQAYEAKKYAFVSDYVRFFVLFEEGGLYFDTDVEILKDMNHIIAVGNFMAFEKSLATQQQDRGEFCTELLGVAPGLGLGVRPGLKIIGELLDLYNAKENFAITDGTVVDYTTEILKRHGMVNEHRFQKVADVNIYPADYFCPMDSTTGIITKTKNTVAIHHYSCSWIDHNTMSWRIHILKNKLIAILGERWILKISQLLRR
ncbi:glycosyltransferase family 32 protein [Bacteroides finegoldii]|uniref:glycosyltransferase family 32 protein n=1 Tax=Bacteroides finegoldii TaxID=338188 RepID=UPI00189DE492|nr:glycosyltransferase [Bacteroides finegoldii]